MSAAAHEFVKEVFSELPAGARPVVAGFVGNPKDRNDANWSAIGMNGVWPEHLTEECNLYVSLSSIVPGASGEYKNQNKNVAALHMLMIDDVGAGIGAKTEGDGSDLLPPSYIVETSPGNSQFIYLLDKPITDSVYARRLCNALAMQAGGDPDAANNVRWVRLPGGVNGKPEYMSVDGKPVPTFLTHAEPWLDYSVEEIIQAFDLKLDGEKPKADSFESADGEPQFVAMEYKAPMDLSVDKVKGVLKYLKTDSDVYGQWIDVGLALHHQFDGSEQGWEVWDEWSQNSTEYKSSAQTREKWRSFGGNSTTPGNIITFRTYFQKARDIRKKLLAQQKEMEQKTQARSLPSGDLPPFDVMAAVPPRPWLINQYLLRGYVGVIGSPGGIGKSAFVVLRSLAVATDMGEELLGEKVLSPGRVLIINNEDDCEELHRRISAAAIHFNVDKDRLRDNLKVISGYGESYKLMTVTDGEAVANDYLINELIKRINAQGIKYLVIDPLISFHEVDENNNGEVERVVSIFRRIASETKCAIDLIHHTKKGGGDSESHAGNAESTRGASSLINAARIATTLARMTKKRAKDWGLDWERGRRMLRLDSSKGNYSLPDESAHWFEMTSVPLPSGEEIGVPVPFDATKYIDAAKKDKESASKEELEQWRQAVFEEALKIGANKDGGRLSHLYKLLGSRWGVSNDRASRQALRAFRYGEELAVSRTSVDGKRYKVWFSQKVTKGGNAPTLVHVKLALEVV